MEEDPELEAIRTKLRAEVMGAAQQAGPAGLTAPIEVDDASFEAAVAKHPFLVVDCWAPWCGPCRIIGPIIDELAREMSGQVVFGKLNADHNPKTMQAFGVQGIPTLLVFRDGKLLDRIVGALPKPALKGQLERMLRPNHARPGPRRL